MSAEAPFPNIYGSNAEFLLSYYLLKVSFLVLELCNGLAKVVIRAETSFTYWGCHILYYYIAEQFVFLDAVLTMVMLLCLTCLAPLSKNINYPLH